MSSCWISTLRVLVSWRKATAARKFGTFLLLHVEWFCLFQIHFSFMFFSPSGKLR
jgi:hypothetical protein